MKNNIDKVIEDQKYRLSLENKYIRFRHENHNLRDSNYNHKMISKHKSGEQITKRPGSHAGKPQQNSNRKTSSKPGNNIQKKHTGNVNKPKYTGNNVKPNQHPAKKKPVKNSQHYGNKNYTKKNPAPGSSVKKSPAYVTYEDLASKPKRHFILAKKEYALPFSGIAIPAFLVIMLIINIMSEPKEMSVEENRTLAQFPEITFKSLASGSFMSDFESYISDQFAFRNAFVATKRRFEMLTGKKENRNIIVCNDGYLIENTSEIAENNLKANIEAINQLSSIPRYKITMSIVPTAYEVMQSKLPSFAYVNAYGKLQEKLKNNVTNVKLTDVQPILKKNSDKYIYYRSDHHQTALGS